MTDIVDKETRSRMMSGIRAKNTAPELVLRSYLFRSGFRYRLHVATLPGKPDIVLSRYRAVVFVHGCFWHGHTGCKLFRLPKTRTEFWKQKIERNIENDNRVVERLRDLDWRIALIWECGIRNKIFAESVALPDLEKWITGNEPYIEIGRATA